MTWALLAGFSLGLVATTSSRLMQSALYAVEDARTPARIAAQRVLLSSAIGVVLMLQFDRIGVVDGGLALLGDLPATWVLPVEVREDPGVLRLGPLGLVLGGAVAAWYEWTRLSRAVEARTGERLRSAGQARGRLIVPVVAATATGIAVRPLVDDWPRLLGGTLAVALMGLVYVLAALRSGVPEARTAWGMVERVVPLSTMWEIQKGQHRRRSRRRR